MMKKVFISLIALLMTAGASFAVDLKLSGFLEFEGNYWNNIDFQEGDTYAFSNYGQEFMLTTDLVISEATSVKARFDIIRDGEDKYIWGYDYEEIFNADREQDANFKCARLYMTHKFPTETTVLIGNMDGQEWGSKFYNDATGTMRIVVTQMTPYGLLAAAVEKYSDQGAMGLGGLEEDAETDDYDIYYLGGVTKLGPVYVKPLIGVGFIGNLEDETVFRLAEAYELIENQLGDYENVDGKTDATAIAFDLGLDAELEDIGAGFEAEFIYINISFSSEMENYIETNSLGFAKLNSASVFGLYVNGWYNIEPAKVGMWIAYGGYDEDVVEVNPIAGPDIGEGFDFNDDFNSTTILGDTIGFNGGDDIKSATAIQLYADVTIPSVEKLTVSPSFTYVMSNVKDDDTTAIEFDIDCSYKISDALSYSAGIAYASISADTDDTPGMYAVTDSNGDLTDPDPAMKLYHMVTLEF